MLRNSAKLISVSISTTYQDALQPDADSRPRWQFLNGRAIGQSFVVAVGDVTVVLPAEVFSERLRQAGERGAIGEFDVGGAATPCRRKRSAVAPGVPPLTAAVC